MGKTWYFDQQHHKHEDHKSDAAALDHPIAAISSDDSPEAHPIDSGHHQKAHYRPTPDAVLKSICAFPNEL